MGFFQNNPVIDFFQKVVRKPESILMWLFTGMIFTSTVYLMFLPGPTLDNDLDEKKKNPH
ncbi:hypothetical protein J7297_01416 [Nakaseomyces glabratus]|nr:hypothetical protein J7298_01423 [Nakaseomyces glabratus]KAH7589467.1 hypothetical protein J7297_01416 [Nakaseomyces glabratus]KAH7594638.1 hypothetical protein J7296_01418 [Nakaseomyces glabratus]KAH7604137.1 hypothetical protein J7295_01429 [Nakaseomyces glabratus]KAH7605122.1 hypothetical protein J7294_01415 [Nakaseomyces glabratus]